MNDIGTEGKNFGRVGDEFNFSLELFKKSNEVLQGAALTLRDWFYD